MLSRVGEEIFEQLNTKIQKEQIQTPTSFPLVDLEIKPDSNLVKINIIEQTAINIKTQIDILIKRLTGKGIWTNGELDELSKNFSYLIKERSKK